MTVWAHWSKIIRWIHFVFSTNIRQWDKMMNVNIPCADLSIAVLESQITSSTR